MSPPRELNEIVKLLAHSTVGADEVRIPTVPLRCTYRRMCPDRTAAALHRAWRELPPSAVRNEVRCESRTPPEPPAQGASIRGDCAGLVTADAYGVAASSAWRGVGGGLRAAAAAKTAEAGSKESGSVPRKRRSVYLYRARLAIRLSVPLGPIGGCPASLRNPTMCP